MRNSTRIAATVASAGLIAAAMAAPVGAAPSKKGQPSSRRALHQLGSRCR